MKSLVLIGCSLLLVSCGSPRRAGPALPEDLNGWWRLVEKSDLSGSPMPGVLPEARVTSAIRVVYDGHPRFEAEVWETPNGGTAFEMMQKWRPREKTMAFHKARYFVIVHTGDATPKDANHFVSSLESVLR